jgi:predicted component of type VI protein secretion system
MSLETPRPFLSRLDAADGRVPYEVLARWCRNNRFDGVVSPGNYDSMLLVFQQAHRKLSYAEVVQQSVLDNIQHILNASQMPMRVLIDAGLSADSSVGQSVLNFGIPPYVGGYDYRVYVRDFSEGVRQALLTYEPRLEENSLRVIVETSNPEHPLAGEIKFTIEGNIAGLEYGNHMELETVVRPFKSPELDRSRQIFS